MAYDSVDKEWEARCDFETLTKAQEIMADPKRKKAALAYGKKEAKVINKVLSQDVIKKA